MGNCVVCHRIPPQFVAKLVHEAINYEYSYPRFHEVKPNKNQIHDLIVEMIEMISITDKNRRTFFCGKSKLRIVWGLLYILAIKHSIKLSQRSIVDSSGKYNREVTLQNGFRAWLKEFPSFFPLIDISPPYAFHGVNSDLALYDFAQCWDDLIMRGLK